MALPVLDSVSQRVLGSLLEKQMSTPEYYPLTLNSLLNACNQSSNRAPVMKLEEGAMEEALEVLRQEKLIWEVKSPGSRTIKYEHRVRDVFNLSEQEAALLCELLLRGPQTPGELRSRTARLYAFQDLAEVEAALDCLVNTETPLAIKLSRQPGAREARFAHCLGVVEEIAMEAPTPEGRGPSVRDEIQALREELQALRAEFESFKAQF